jgi:N-acyl-D-amino-acid deacylase
VLDWVISGATVIDGSGRPGTAADVGIRGELISEIGDLGTRPARHRIDGVGKTVTPGFIDAHSHSDLTALANPEFQSTIRQGVTTEVVGNCGLSVAPIQDEAKRVVDRQLRAYGYAGDATWRTFGEYLERLEQARFSANLAWFVGHGALRQAAGIKGTRVDDQQERFMRRELESALDSGALGLSSGLEYEPGRAATTDEILDLATVVGRRAGYYSSHIRNRDRGLASAVDEFLEVTARSGSRGQISHLNVRYGTGAAPHAWEQAVQAMERSRATGVDVMADTTPFTFGIGLMINVLPPWLASEGPSEIAKQLSDLGVRERVRSDVDRYWRFLDRGEWHRARPLNSRAFPDFNGLTIAQIAERSGRDPWDAYLDLIEAAGSDMGDLWMLGDLFTEDHLVEMIEHPLFLLGADTMSSQIVGPMADQMRHNPISFGAHLHFIRRYGRELKVMPLERLVYKMTSMVANRFGLVDRGVLRPGAAADVVVLDLDVVGQGTSSPTGLTGIDHVFVNGAQVIDEGRHTGARPGRHLRAP